jgi:hypothetical protein
MIRERGGERHCLSGGAVRSGSVQAINAEVGSGQIQGGELEADGGGHGGLFDTTLNGFPDRFLIDAPALALAIRENEDHSLGFVLGNLEVGGFANRRQEIAGTGGGFQRVELGVEMAASCGIGGERIFAEPLGTLPGEHDAHEIVGRQFIHQGLGARHQGREGQLLSGPALR